MIDARFASTNDSQDVRRKVAEGVIDNISIVFLGHEWKAGINAESPLIVVTRVEA